ncbi:PQQ-like beta-propeller repeat protein [Pirellulales bacterium]|nr:PQQ-like beta-propeller repeat protein [Pirellulales bacterium]
MIIRRIVIPAVVLLIPGISAGAEARDWPAWRGPAGNGTAAEGEYPIEFSNEQHVAWKAELPGRGSSTPCVWGDAIFITCLIDDQDAVCRYDFDGNLKWTETLGPGRAGKHPNGSGANPSPTTDGECVVVYYKSGTLAALDFGGNILWKKNLQKEYGKDTLWWDLGTSPILCEGKVIVAVMQGAESKQGEKAESYLAAFDLKNGDVVWREPRNYKRPVESDQAYTTPSIVEIDGNNQIVVWGADYLTGHDPQTGTKLWECGGFNPKEVGMQRVIASQAIGSGIAVVPNRRGDFLTAVRLGGKGDVSESSPVWEKHGVGADVPTPVIAGNDVYVLSDRGAVTKLDLSTGEEVWSHDLPRAKSNYYASPVLAGDLLYCSREDGVVFVARVGDKFELVADNRLDEPVLATPIPVRNGLLIRGPEHLYWIK